MPHIRFTNRVQRHVACPDEPVAGSTILAALNAYFQRHPVARGYVLDQRDRLRPNMTIFIDGEAMVDRNQLEQPIEPSTGARVFRCSPMDCQSLPGIWSFATG